jgi:nucleotide-binding universal stress UspA family protein
MSALKILVPYNFTDNDDKAIDFVIDSFGRSPDAEITLFHTYVPLPKLDISDKTVMTRISGNLTYLQQKTSELEDALARAAERLVAGGFDKERVHFIFKARQSEPAQEIIDQANKGHFTTIVLNHHPSKVRKFFTASTAKKVAKALMHKELHIVG